MNVKEVISRIYNEVRPLASKGEVAQYIPELSTISPNFFGMSVHGLDGSCTAIGDADEVFSIQSISKVFTFTLAFKALGESIWERLGKEPSGNAFNSLVQLENEQGVPRNPFINAGAIVLADIMLSHYSNPEQELLDFVRKLTHEQGIDYNRKVAASEQSVGYRNIALAYFMKSFNTIHNKVEDVLDFYFLQCSLEMCCKSLSNSFLYLANHGVVPGSGEPVLTKSQAKRLSALMLTTGLYNESGDFAYRVGMPAKSGVGGGIVAIIPQKLSMCVWSPPLNKYGNSLAGIEALERFTTYTGESIF